MNWIPIFRAGTHTDSQGNEKTWTEAELDIIVAKYHPDEHEAPAVIGHPEHNAPAWGWVHGLRRDGQILLAQFKDLVPEFVDMVKKGLFKKRSISLYPDMTLRHVGFLGAMPPAVKGLPDVAFKDGDGQVIEFSFDCKQCKKCLPDCPPLEGAGGRSNSGNFSGKEQRRMKWFDWMKKKAADEGVTIEDAPSFSEPGLPAMADVRARIDAEVAKQTKAKELEFAEAQKKLDAEDARLKAEGVRLKKAEDDRLQADIKSFCEDLQKKGTLTPAMMKHGMGMQNFLEAISGDKTAIEFSDGDTKKTQTPFEYMKSFLSAFKKQIEFGEVATESKDFQAKGNASEKLSQLTQAKLKGNKGMNYGEAFSEVQKENPELAKEYAIEIRG